MPRRYRKRRDSSAEEEEEPDRSEDRNKEDEVSKKLEEAKEIQKFRKRPVGVSAVGLAFGKKFTEEENVTPDPFKLKAGGLVDLKELQAAEAEKAEDEVLQRLANTFSAETKQRDDNTHMLQYIENEMSKQEAATEPEEQSLSTYDAKIKSLYKLPERINFKEKSKTEEMLSNQMLSGIPEVDLGIEAKFRNIEETELAKQKLVEDRMAKGQERPSMAPTNMATNFTLHSLRFFKNDRGQSEAAKKEKAKEEEQTQQPAYIPVVGESEPELKPVGQADSHKRKIEHTQLATDDYHYDKFRKRTRRF